MLQACNERKESGLVGYFLFTAAACMQEHLNRALVLTWPADAIRALMLQLPSDAAHSQCYTQPNRALFRYSLPSIFYLPCDCPSASRALRMSEGSSSN